MADSTSKAANSAPLLFVGVFALTVWRLAPSLDWLDGGNLVASAWWLGVAHPPGEPAWLAAARLAQLLPIGDIAFRVNLLSAGCLAACVWPIASLVSAVGGGLRALVFAVCAGLLGFSVQLQGVRAEVYAPTLLILLMALAAAVRGGRRGSAATGLLLGIGAGVHPLLCAAAVPALVAARWRRGPWGREDVLLGLVGGLGGFVVYAWLPLRALADPGLAWGQPDTPGRFVDVLLARNFAQNFGGEGSLAHNLGVVWGAWAGALLPGTALLAGWAVVRSRGDAAVRALAWALPLWLLANALTILTQNKVLADNPDLHGYLAVGAVAVAPLAGRGLELLDGRVGRVAQAGAWGLVALLVFGGTAASRSDNHLARRFDTELAAQLPPGSVLLPAENSTAFGWRYLQGVERRRSDLVVVPRSLLGHRHERLRLADGLAAVGLPWLPELREEPLQVLGSLRRPLYLELREPELDALRDGRLLRHGLVAGWAAVPSSSSERPQEPERLRDLRADALGELESQGAGDAVAGWTLARYRQLWGAEP